MAPATVLLLGLLCVAAFTWGSLQSVELLAGAEVRAWHPTEDSGRDHLPRHCASTAPGRNYVADNRGHVCHWKDTLNGCCTGVHEEDRYSCGFCNSTAECCLVYEYCVSCCLAPANNNLVVSMMLSTADPILQAANTQFDFCQAKCRTSSQSVVDHKQYKSEHKFCYGTHQPSSDADEGSYEPASLTLPPSALPVAIRGQEPMVITEGAAGRAQEAFPEAFSYEHDIKAGALVAGAATPLLAEQQRRDEIYSQPVLAAHFAGTEGVGVGVAQPRAGSKGKLDTAAGKLVENGREQLKPVAQSDYETVTFVDGVVRAPRLNFGNVAWDMDSMFESAASSFGSAGVAGLPFTAFLVLAASLLVLWR